jgi:hypothetical protein
MDEFLRFLTPFRYLAAAGSLLVLMGLAGLTGVLGRISSAAFFHPPYWINGAHLIFGGVLLIVAFASGPEVQSTFVLVGTIAGLALGSSGLMFGPLAARRFHEPALADPSDHVAHLLVGVLAFWAWHNRLLT